MASRKEEKERRRRERLEREREAAEQTQRRRLYTIVVGAGLVIGAIVAIVVVAASGGGGSGGSSSGYSIKAQNTAKPPLQTITDINAAASKAGCVLRNPPIEGNMHVPDSTPVTYHTNPPTSGNHNPVPTPDGVYTKEPNVRMFVHTLEHGRVEVQYSPSLPKHDVALLGGLFNEGPHDMLLFPNPKMPYQVATTAWEHLLGCKKMNNGVFDAIRTFRDRYRDNGPEPASAQPSNF